MNKVIAIASEEAEEVLATVEHSKAAAEIVKIEVAEKKDKLKFLSKIFQQLSKWPRLSWKRLCQL